MISLDATQERVGITAYFQGEIKHSSLPLSIGGVKVKLPGSNTEISLAIPNEPCHGRFQPLKFCIRKEGDWRNHQHEGIRLTADNAKNFVMSINVFEPGPKIGPHILQQNGTIKQQETLRRTEIEVPITRQLEITPGAQYRLEISSTDGSSAEANLVKIEDPLHPSITLGEDSKLFQTVYPSITILLRLKVLEAKMHTSPPLNDTCHIVFNSEFNENLAKRSMLTAINKLHSEQQRELEEMCKTANATHDIPLGEKALGLFVLALDRTDIGQLLKDQLEVAVGKDKYPHLLGVVYNSVYIRFIEIIINNAKKYVSNT